MNFSDKSSDKRKPFLTRGQEGLITSTSTYNSTNALPGLLSFKKGFLIYDSAKLYHFRTIWQQ